jgi:hypothetical protein
MSIKENTKKINIFEEYLKNINLIQTPIILKKPIVPVQTTGSWEDYADTDIQFNREEVDLTAVEMQQSRTIVDNIKDMKKMSEQFNVSISSPTTKLEINNITRFNKIIEISNISIEEFKNLSPNDSSGNFIGPDKFIEKINGLNDIVKNYFKYNYDILQNEIQQLQIIPIIEQIISQKAYKNIKKSIKILEANSRKFNDVIIEGEQILTMYKKVHELLIKGDKLFGIINRFIELLKLKHQLESFHIFNIDELTLSINEKWKNLQFLTVKVFPEKKGTKGEEKTTFNIVKNWIELNILIAKKEISKSNYTEESNLRRILNDTGKNKHEKEEEMKIFDIKIDEIKKKKESLLKGKKLLQEEQNFLQNAEKEKNERKKEIQYLKASQIFYNEQITNLSTDKISVGLREFKNYILHIINIKNEIEQLEIEMLLLSEDIYNLKISPEIKEIEESIRNPKPVVPIVPVIQTEETEVTATYKNKDTITFSFKHHKQPFAIWILSEDINRSSDYTSVPKNHVYFSSDKFSYQIINKLSYDFVNKVIKGKKITFKIYTQYDATHISNISELVIPEIGASFKPITIRLTGKNVLIPGSKPREIDIDEIKTKQKPKLESKLEKEYNSRQKSKPRDSYEMKYLKYKSKYLTLKKLVNL